MPATPDDLFAYLDSHGIAHDTTAHAPIFTVEEGRDLKARLPGLHTKNLFLKDKKGALFLLCAEGEAQIDLNATAKVLGAGRFSFGSPDLLLEVLGVTPGSVTLFALINDKARRVRLVMDDALMRADVVNFHPLTNAATTAISGDGLRRFLDALERTPDVLAFDADGAPRAIEAGR
ncbi:MAG: prolyl-tRNA synthetase associated domain-containing protein [Alphaproteobacteria bacterium]|nr:prolyl-tRNA synthetase associated domain-containing protein [Alphaproteobacteria bacterium]